MASWIVFTRNDPGSADDAADRVVFVRDRFSWLALIFTPIVLLWHGLWLAFILFMALAAGLQALVFIAGIPPMVPPIILAGASLLVALDLAGLRARKLVRQGYDEETVISAPSLVEAEQRFFDRWSGPSAPAQPVTPPPAPSGRPPGLIEGPPSWRAVQGQAKGPIIGSLDTGNTGA
ncbi:DUF2628 domain-containing protein [Xanthobacter sp. TB0136]|uniref:DUF2628 domain-containing protein n=1 Tax=Xanthobacter sp. TB0136 TaxID=3459177 RepID=UPI004039E422